MTSFTVNGQPVHYRMDPATPLLWALRDASNLTGTKYGCGTGHCGACTVHVDGNAVRACRVPISAIKGSFVVTIEGLSRDRSHPVQQAFAANMVPQCGYCIPGMIMAAAGTVAVAARINPINALRIAALLAYGSRRARRPMDDMCHSADERMLNRAVRMLTGTGRFIVMLNLLQQP